MNTGTDALYSEALLKMDGRIDAKVKIRATEPEHKVIAAAEGDA